MPFWLLPNHKLQQCIVSHILLLYVVIFLNLSTTTAWDIGDMFICGKYQIFCVSSSLGIRFEFQPTQIGVVFLPSVSISAIYIISFFHASDSFSSIRSVVKICFGLSKEVYQGCWALFCMMLRRVPLAHVFVGLSAFLILALFNYLKFCLSIISC